MKLILAFTFLVSSLIFSGTVMAQDNMSKVSDHKENKSKEVKKKKRRRKKALMCNDCGKPESECDCEGHGDHEGNKGNHKDGHKHSDDEKHSDDGGHSHD